MADYIDRQQAIDAIANTIVRGESLGMCLAEDILYDVPSENIGGVLERNIDNIRQAWIDGKEFRCRIGGRLFAVRELPQ